MSRAVVSGAIPGLLRECSPVVRDDGTRCIVVHAYDNDKFVLAASLDPDEVDRFVLALNSCALDLTHPTGRTHAAWWLAEQDEDVVNEAIEAHVYSANLGADVLGASWVSGRSLTPAHVEALRLVVEQVAREVSRG